MELQREVFFVDGSKGQRFCLLTRPGSAPRGGLLYLHPFAEEMNKCRRMAALGARAFAERGWLVLQMDAFGCGDSAGDFGDAGWHDWLEDVALGRAWLRRHCDAPPVLWTLRAGSLLAAEWLAQSDEQLPLLMWQPVMNGRQHLTQFLRLKAAHEMLADSDATAVMARVRAELERGRAVEIAGYTLAPALASGLDAATVRLPRGYRAPVAMLEVGSAERLEPSPALTMLAGRLREDAVPVMVAAVAGPAFWQSLEVETAPALIDASLQALKRFVL